MVVNQHSSNVQMFSPFVQEPDLTDKYLARSADNTHVLSEQQEVHTWMEKL